MCNFDLYISFFCVWSLLGSYFRFLIVYFYDFSGQRDFHFFFPLVDTRLDIVLRLLFWYLNRFLHVLQWNLFQLVILRNWRFNSRPVHLSCRLFCDRFRLQLGRNWHWFNLSCLCRRLSICDWVEIEISRFMLGLSGFHFYWFSRFFSI
jgi:hypothetical protein